MRNSTFDRQVLADALAGRFSFFRNKPLLQLFVPRPTRESADSGKRNEEMNGKVFEFLDHLEGMVHMHRLKRKCRLSAALFRECSYRDFSLYM